MYDEVNQDILTPNKLLFGRNLETTVSDNVEVETNLSKRAKYIDTLLDHWWKRWREDYLTELREHHKFKTKRCTLVPKIGDVVLIADDKLRRSEWKIGRVTELIMSKDKRIRCACVRMGKKGRILRRPINKLYPIVKNDEPAGTDA